jgi:pimeloyl-ACP methyl ester carboxylesterase
MDASSRSEKSTTGRALKVPAFLKSGLDLTARLSPSWAAGLAARLFMTPRRHKRPVREVALLERAQALPPDESGLAIWRWGSGPAVILAHGWEGRGAQLGAFVDPLVSAGFSVIAYDAPAHGASPGRTASLIDFRDALRQVAHRVGQVHAVIAHSFGAPATQMALDKDISAQCVVFIAPPSRFDGFEKFVDVFQLSEDVKDKMQRRLEESVGVRFADLDPISVAHRMITPLLVVHDSDDQEVSIDSGVAIASAWPGASLRETRGLGHRRILRDPTVVRTVVDFIGGFLPDRPALIDLERALDLDQWKPMI